MPVTTPRRNNLLCSYRLVWYLRTCTFLTGRPGPSWSHRVVSHKNLAQKCFLSLDSTLTRPDLLLLVWAVGSWRCCLPLLLGTGLPEGILPGTFPRARCGPSSWDEECLSLAWSAARSVRVSVHDLPGVSALRHRLRWCRKGVTDVGEGSSGSDGFWSVIWEYNFQSLI